MKTIAVIPVHGRLPLLKHTITRLLKKNCVHTVLTAGSTDEEREVCEAAGATFIYHDNQPLGKKWNSLFKLAADYKPDNVLFVGSSDWVSDNWVPYMNDYTDEFDMIGLAGFYLLDIGKEYRVCFWPGYGPGPRAKEPIGIGRVISRRILEKINWAPFDETKSRSMDHQMMVAVQKAGGAIKLLATDDIKSLSISTSLWGNMHIFEDHWMGRLPSHVIQDHNFLPTHFPEAYKIF